MKGHPKYLKCYFQHGGGSDQLRHSEDWVDNTPGTVGHQHHGGHVHCQEGQGGAGQDADQQPNG